MSLVGKFARVLPSPEFDDLSGKVGVITDDTCIQDGCGPDVWIQFPGEALEDAHPIPVNCLEILNTMPYEPQ